MKIKSNLWQVGGADFTAPEDAAIYLLRMGDEAALIDAGCGYRHERLVQNISKALPPAVIIHYLFLTHCHFDHSGGAAAVRDHYGCVIVAHELDAQHLESGDSTVTAASWYGAHLDPLRIDYKIKSGKETFQLGNGEVVAYHVPGHSPGSLVYLVELDSTRVLFGQDVHGPLDSSFLSNRTDYVRSLEFMLTLNADILCEGHFGIFLGKDQINRFIRSYL